MRTSGSPLPAAVLDRLYGTSGAAKWALSREAFGDAVGRSVAHAFGERPPAAGELERYTTSLHLDDLALAAACAEGQDAAWESFIATHRPVLQRAADAIDPTGGARELADSLYADLYGMGDREGTRRSLFRYFHGRSKLSTWLRAVLAQRHIDRLRAGRKLDPLPDDQDLLPAQGNGDADRSPHPERSRFESAMQAALAGSIAALPARDRLRLSCYYVQDLTLAAIGRLLKEHEATVSRHLARTRTAIRDAVWTRLRSDHGMDDGAIVECFRAVSADAGAMDLASLIGNPAGRKKSQPDRSRE